MSKTFANWNKTKYVEREKKTKKTNYSNLIILGVLWYSTDEEMESMGAGNFFFGISIYKW